MGYIYCITNLINNKQYIGKTTYSVTKRFKEHCEDSKRPRCEKRPLYDAMNKYGIENFVVQELLVCDNEELSSYEIQFIDKYQTYSNGYNATKGGDGSILFDYKEIINLYKKGGNILEVSRKIGCSTDTVRNVLKNNNIDIRPISKEQLYENGLKKCLNPKVEVLQLSSEEKIINSFSSIADAAHWLVDNGYAKTYNGGVRQKISMCCKGTLKSAYTFKWKIK